MPDAAMTQDFTANKLAFLQTHMLTIMGGAPSPEDQARRVVISGYCPSKQSAAIKPRVGEQAPDSVNKHPSDLWADTLAAENYVRGTPKILGFGLDDGSSKYFARAVGVRNKIYKVTFSAPNNPATATNPNAYYLPYSAKSTYTMTLGNQCDFFFTDAINGCSFQVTGTRTRPIVTHANVQGVFNDAMKREFLHQMLEPARREAAAMGGRIPTSRLQRFEPTSTAERISDINFTEYGTNADARGVPATIGGYQQGRTTIQSQGVTYEVISKFTDPGGAVLDPSGGEVAVIGFKDATDAWTFHWQMFLPVQVTTDFYRVTSTGGTRRIDYAHTVTYRDYFPIVQAQQLWP